MARDKQVNRRSFLKAAGGASAATMVTAGCITGNQTSTSGGSGGTLTYSRGNDSSTLDPQATTSGEDAKVMHQVYDRLVHFKPGGSSLRRGLAKEFSLEGKTATLDLREDATFHNGDDFTAGDFIATYRRFLDEDYEHFIGEDQSIYGPYLLGQVKNVSKDGDYTVNFELKSRYAPFLANLAVFALGVLPKKAITGDRNIGEKPVGTGPFSFDKWNQGNQTIRLKANDDYWGKTPSVDEVVFEAIGENSTRAQSLTNGESDVIDGIGAQQVGSIENASKASLKRTPGMTIGYMAFNMARMEPFRDKQVRQAISHAIDTEAIVENIYKGLAVQASHPLPPNVMGHNEDLDPYPYDPDKAQSMLEDAGYGDGFEFELATMTNPRPYFPSPVQTAQTVQSNLEEVGITVNINQQSWEPYLTYTAEGKHDACFLGWISDNADPDNFYSPLLSPGIPASDVPEGQDWVSFDTEGFNTGNRAAWANREFIRKVNSAKKNYDEGQRESTYLEVAEIVHEEAPWVFVTHTEELAGVHQRVNNYTIAPISGPFLNEVSLK